MLACYPQVTKCLTISQKGRVYILASTIDGSIQIWDLRSVNGIFWNIECDQQKYNLKMVDYSTDGINDLNNVKIHSLPIINLFTSNDEFEGAEFPNIISLDQSGLINIWVI
jgi:WD40 repeat protein